MGDETPTVTHLDEGLNFLGFRGARGGGEEILVYTYPSKKALASVTDKVQAN